VYGLLEGSLPGGLRMRGILQATDGNMSTKMGVIFTGIETV